MERNQPSGRAFLDRGVIQTELLESFKAPFQLVTVGNGEGEVIETIAGTRSMRENIRHQWLR